MKTLSAIILFLGSLLPLSAQQKQTVRGVVLDNQSKTPLAGATIVVAGSDPLIGAATDGNGNFRLENVPVGRQNIRITYIGYKEVTLSNIVVNSGKEVVLSVEMEEEILTGSEVTVKARQDKSATNNELISISGRAFTIDETNRYAGSLGDPSRMASNFAGVSGGGSDQRNDIIIRGNSPLGLLWRLESADIPNPNHFSNQGANGGPVSILNNNTLANSDFITGAWPAEYGSATSGVFDLKMRNGNNEKREHTFQMGFNGVEMMTEGPFKKGGASYLFSYRYSTLALFDKLGFRFGESGIPEYQDFSLKLNFPTKKLGTFSLWGIGGMSATNINSTGRDTGELKEMLLPQDVQFSSGMFASGLTHIKNLGSKSYIKTVYSLSGERNRTIVDTLHSIYGTEKSMFFSSTSRSLKHSLHSFYNRKINARNSFKAGIILSRFHLKMDDSTSDWREPDGWRVNYSFNESVYLGQAYVNWTHRFSEKFTVNSGLHFNHLFFNNTSSLEPRLGARYAVNKRSNLSFGYGLHGQGQPLPVYFQQTHLPGGQTVLTNRDLGFTQSHHLVAGYDRMLTENIKLKTEVYFQYLTNVPVTRHPSIYSVINFGAEFGGLPKVDSLESRGTGKNYGAEITLEKYFSDGYYFLLTTSLFESRYKASDNIWRHTAFSSNYVVNLLAGKEFRMGKNNVLSASVKGTFAGGRREIPTDLAQSRIENRFVADNSRAYESRLPGYSRVDLRIGFKMNGKRITQEWALDLQNVFNIKNILTRQYNPATGDLRNIYQIGFFPVPLYRLQF